jgi:predicted secreted protein
MEEIPMLSKKIFFLTVGALCASVFALWAGDTASFVDLGFSSGGGTYIFAQYGVRSGTLKPWADMFVVDVARNDFVSGGKISYTHDAPVSAGTDGSGAFYRLVSRNIAIAERYEVNFLRQGIPLYIALDTDDGSPHGETIEFRNFERNLSCKARLIPSIEGSGSSLKSSFYIDLEETNASGTRKTYRVGNPGVKRPLIETYKIKKVIVAPEGNSLIFVIETKKQVPGGYDSRYMVETMRW